MIREARSNSSNTWPTGLVGWLKTPCPGNTVLLEPSMLGVMKAAPNFTYKAMQCWGIHLRILHMQDMFL